ncbi:MAG TPA: GspMb/PilO family protein [Vicinamibacterales bacterium]|jgi:hypothetical protein|nr:GspMb/PilO family protein [Vicinamibacterales bacterium]
MLWKRILSEKRALIIPLALGLVANLVVYLIVVRPLAAKSVGAVGRASNAKRSLAAAEGDHAAAGALLTGKARADQELSTFFDKVLPPDFVAARRLTYAKLPELAKQANVKFVERRTEPDLDPSIKNAGLGRLQIKMVLQGEYEGLRQFIYELERASEFIIIDDVTITQNELAKPLTLNLELSTYYRQSVHGN